MTIFSRVQFLLSLLLICLPAFSAENQSIVTDIVYGHKDGLALTFDAHLPVDGNGAAVIIINSGGHRSPRFDLGGTYAQSDLPSMRPHQSLLEEGYVVFDLRHGSIPRYSIPEIVVDIQQGVEFIYKNSEQYDVNPKKIGVWGQSAGGHLALLVALNPGLALASESEGNESHLVSAVVAMAPLTDLASLLGSGREGTQGPPGMDFIRERYSDFSPSSFASAGDPPTLLIHGTEDNLVPMSQSQRMHNALQDVGTDVQLLVIEGAGHLLWLREEIFQPTLDWFNNHLLGN